MYRPPALICRASAGTGSRPEGRQWLALIGACGLLTLLGGCGSLGKAPVEDRTDTVGRAPITSGTYRVEPGDTLWSIAWRAGLDYRQVSDWNRLPPPYTIYPGQRLRLTSPYPPVSTPPPGRSARIPAHSATPVRKPPPAAPPADVSAPEPPRAEPAPASATVMDHRHASEASADLRWRWPTEGRVVQGFSDGDASRKGVKISGTLGQPIYAAEAGRVVYSGSGLIGYGQLIIIKHNNDFLSAYGYNSKILVKEGEQVTKGEHIAEMGRNGGGPPMLHFEIRRRGKPVDPERVLSLQ